ncbi:MAG: hypothetical protein M3133_07195 [Actinomycetota bacterium]|nr:hypothetical protein [Actinomycetota bacterium]
MPAEAAPGACRPHNNDDVFITTQLELLGDIDSSEPATLILPLASEAQQQPIVRYTEEPVRGPQVFSFDKEVERSVYDQQVVERLETLADGASKREQRALATAIGRATKSLSVAAVEVKPGQRKLRLFYSIAADKVAEKEFEFSVIGPLPSFVIQTGGSIGVIALLPRNTSIVTAEALADPNNPASAIQRTDANLGGRPAMGRFWQNDPLFRVRIGTPKRGDWCGRRSAGRTGSRADISRTAP